MLPLIASALIIVAADRADGPALSPEHRQQAVRVIELTIQTRYAEAFALADSLSRGGVPTFRMLKLMGIGLRDMDFETAVDSAEFGNTYRLALQEVQGMSAGAYKSTLLGFVLAARSGRDLRDGRYAAAVRSGREALELMRTAASTDSTFADPDYFLGLYDFTMADLRKRLWWVLFWLPGDRERGIARLERSRTQSLFAADAALLSLLDAYVHQKRFDKAEVVLRDLESRFPQSRFMLWGKARYEEGRGELVRAAAVYGALWESYDRESLGRLNAAVCRFEQARLLAAAGRKPEALEACRRAVQACTLGVAPGACTDAERLLRKLEHDD
jgi:pentatricopeptide repeat protein